MQIEVYKMTAEDDALTITLEAICDTFSSLLWDIEYYKCGSFEVYIAANPQNVDIFQPGRIVGRDDDNQHFGIIESVQINTDVENGDYLTVKGRFLMSLLERRIINPTLSITADTAYSDIVRNAVTLNAIQQDNRRIPGLFLGTVSGSCWEQTATLQVSYTNLMEWMYTICEKIGGTANIRLVKDIGETYKMVLDLSEGTDRSLTQDTEPHISFRSLMLQIPLSLATSPISMGMVKVLSANIPHIVSETNRHICHATNCMWTQRISQRRNRSSAKQCRFRKRSISSC